MKILFVVPFMGFGGAERVISILSNSFIHKNDSVKILVLNKESKLAYKLDSKIEVTTIEGKKLDSYYGKYKFLKFIRSNVKNYNPDIIISFMLDTCAITCLSLLGTGFPIIYSERNDPSNTNTSLKGKLYKFIVNSLASGFVFQSIGAKMLYPKKVQNKSVIILNPIDYDTLPKYYRGTRSKEIINVGRLVSQKNQKMLIKSFSLIAKNYPDYKLLIYGDGPLKDELRDLIKNLKLDKQILLMGNSSDILDRINKSSVFVLTSIYEGLPNALIEAMVMGVPCISTDCSPGGAAMLINNDVNGILVGSKSSDDFSKNLDILLSNSKKAKGMGLEAKKIIERVRKEKIILEWENYILSILKK